MKTQNLFLALTLFTVVLTAGCKKDTFTETIGLCPIVISTNPSNGATNVPLTQIITVTFNKKMNPSTITDASIYFEGTSAIGGTLTYSDSTATFTPSSPLSINTTYKGTVKTFVQDVKGNALQEDYVWTFSTGASISPMVISTDPADNDTGVALNKIITATFNMPMEPSTLNGSTFTLHQGINQIGGTVSYSGTTAYFNPTANLLQNTDYTATITMGAQNPQGGGIDSNYVWTFKTGTILLQVPEVISTDPANNETNVVLNKNITATFSMPMNPSTITGATFTLKLGANTIPGTVSYSGTTATFNPTNNLLPDTVYTGTITMGAQNLAGTPIANDFIWSFRTGTTLLIPEVVSTDPANNETNVVLNKNITATFNMSMNPSTISGATFTLRLGTNTIPGAVSYSGMTATFNPTSNLLPDTVYTATITTGAQNLSGTSIAVDYVWTFRTLSVVSAPVVISTDPDDNETNVALNKSITATFNMPMNPLTISGATFTVKIGATTVPGAVSYIGNTATFNPTNILLSNTVYTATITTGAQNLTGTPLANDYVWTFTTATPLGPVGVNLGCAADFAILAGATVVNTGFTIVDGDLGLSPGTSVTGFPPGVVTNGSILINTQKANDAKLCLTTAYNDAAGRSLNVINIANGQLGGLTLAPGLYRSGISSFEIIGSDLTLDAQGDANTVWIFQMPSSTLTVGNGIRVTLINGASANNIFWQVGTSATIGTTAEMKGNILADQSITLQTGASLLGRALTRIAAVTLDFNAVTKP